MPTASLDRHIESTPGVCGGRPRIAGRRVRVQDIAVWHLRQNWPVSRIAAEFDLTLGDVHAALAYYFDHQQEIEDALARDVLFEAEMKKKHPSRTSQEAGDGNRQIQDDHPEQE